MMRRILPVIILIAALCAAVATAQDASKKARAKAGGDSAAADTQEAPSILATRLGSDDPTQRRLAVAEVRSMLAKGDARANRQFHSHFMPAMFKAGLHDDLSELALLAMANSPNDAQRLWEIADARTRSLMASGKAAEALASAKSAFNVAPMEYTADSIHRLRECLLAAYPDDPSKADRFRQEQVAGTGADMVAEIDRSATLDAIAIDPAPYEKAIAKLAAKPYVRYQDLTGHGNLLLLAGRPAEARKLFARAYSLADEKQLPAATENIARAMKAEDGTIGRANAWVQAIRPRGE